MSWVRDGLHVATHFTGCMWFSQSSESCSRPVNHVTRSDPALAQLNLDSPQHALSNGYRVWGVEVTLGCEGNYSSSAVVDDMFARSHGMAPG